MAGELEVFDGGGYKPTITIFPKRKISKSSGGVVYKMLIPFEDCNKLLQIFKGKWNLCVYSSCTVPWIKLIPVFCIWLEAISKIGFWFKFSRRRSAGQERGTEFQPADILKYFEELEFGPNIGIGTKDLFEMASLLWKCRISRPVQPQRIDKISQYTGKI